MNEQHRNALAHRILDRFLCKQLDRWQFDLALDKALAWTDGPPSIDDVDAIVAASGSTRVR